MKKEKKYSKVKIQSKRIVLRPYLFSDFQFCKHSNENRLKKRNKFDEEIPISKLPTYEEFKKRAQDTRRHAKMKVHFIFGIFDLKNNAYIGQIDLFVINKQLRWGNLGFHIHNQFWSKGYATEAGKLALKLAFRNLRFHRIEAGTEKANKASRQVLKKLKLNYEGERKKFFPENGGIDMVFYATNALDFK